MQQFAGAGDGFARQPRGERAPAGRRRCRPASSLRPAGTHRPGPEPDTRGHRVHQRSRRSPIRPCRWRRADRVGELALARRDLARCGQATVMPRPMAAGVFGMARTIAVPAGSALLQKAERAAGHDREHQRRLADIGRERAAPPPARVCGLTAITMRGRGRGLALRIERDAAPRQRLHGSCRLRLEHR